MAKKKQTEPMQIVRRFQSARSNLLIALILTLVNIVLYAVGSTTYFLFSISLPYYLFDLADPLFIIIPVVVLAFYLCCYLFSKKKPGLMVAALIAFILDCIFLVGYSILLMQVPELGITPADFIIDYLTHIWLLFYLIRGAKYAKPYRLIREGGMQAVANADMVNTVPAETIPEPVNTQSDSEGVFTVIPEENAQEKKDQ